MTSEPGASPFGDLTRRDALRKAAVGAGVAGAAWAAPQILSLDAAAAQSCVPGTLDWDSFSTGATFTSTVINGITVTLSISALAGTTLAPLNGTIRDAPNGGINQKGLYLGMDSSGPGVGIGPVIGVHRDLFSLEINDLRLQWTCVVGFRFIAHRVGLDCSRQMFKQAQHRSIIGLFRDMNPP